MTDTPDIPPDLIAYIDQRVAATGQFLNHITKSEAAKLGEHTDDPMETIALSVALQSWLTSTGAIADALALAIRRLAAK